MDLKENFIKAFLNNFKDSVTADQFDQLYEKHSEKISKVVDEIVELAHLLDVDIKNIIESQKKPEVLVKTDDFTLYDAPEDEALLLEGNGESLAAYIAHELFSTDSDRVCNAAKLHKKILKQGLK